MLFKRAAKIPISYINLEIYLMNTKKTISCIFALDRITFLSQYKATTHSQKKIFAKTIFQYCLLLKLFFPSLELHEESKYKFY